MNKEPMNDIAFMHALDELLGKIASLLCDNHWIEAFGVLRSLRQLVLDQTERKGFPPREL